MSEELINTIITVGGSVVGGGGMTWLFQYFINRRKLTINTHSDMIKFLNKRLEEEKELSDRKLLDERNDCDRKILKLEGMVREQGMRIQELEMVTLYNSDVPIPNWVKDLTGDYRRVNEAALKEIFAPMGIYEDRILGKTDHEIWGSDAVANSIQEVDGMAIRSPFRLASRKNFFLHHNLSRYTMHTYIVGIPNSPGRIAFSTFLIPEHEED